MGPNVKILMGQSFGSWTHGHGPMAWAQGLAHGPGENKTFHNQMVLSTTRWYFPQLLHFHMVLPLLLEPWLWKVPSRWICRFFDVVRSNIWFSVLLLGSYPGWYRPAVVRRLRTQCLWLAWKVMTCILQRGLPFCCTWAPLCCIEAGVSCMERQSVLWVVCSAACGP